MSLVKDKPYCSFKGNAIYVDGFVYVIFEIMEYFDVVAFDWKEFTLNDPHILKKLSDNIHLAVQRPQFLNK